MAEKWVKLGEFKKTKRPGMLVGTIEFGDLKIKVKAFAFLKTGEQKKTKNDPDLLILMPQEESKTDIPPNLF